MGGGWGGWWNVEEGRGLKWILWVKDVDCRVVDNCGRLVNEPPW